MQGTFQVLDLSWERVLLHIDVAIPDGGGVEFFLTPLNDPLGAMHPVEAHSLGDSRYRLAINVTSFNARRQVPNGTYLLVAIQDSTLLRARYELTRVAELPERGRAFVYNGNFSAYTVTFGISEDETSPDFLIRAYAFGRSRGNAGGPINRSAKKAKKRWKTTKRWALRSVYKFARSTRGNGRERILFASEARPSMQGNLKAVHERMVERGLDKAFEFGYSFRTEQTSSRTNAFQLAWQMGRASTILIDDYFAILMDLGDASTQKIIQLWHAGSGFKSIGYSRFGEYGSPHLTNSHRLYSYAICGSQHLRDVYSEAFGIEREAVIATGLPRIDWFLREGRADDVRPDFNAAFPGAVGKRTILFAPTFRGRSARAAYYNYEKIDFEALYDACGEDTVILFRQHHFLQEPAPIPPEYSDRLIDAAFFPDTNDLLLMSDVLITDYSSIIYEYALLNRPMIFFAYDLDTYTATRGMHREYHEAAPGPIATSFGQLLGLIAQPDLSIDKTEAFVRENFDYIDTNNSDRVIDWLILSDPRQSGEARDS